MTMTRHAKIRCQQRGIPPIVIDLLRQFGVEQKAPGGGSKIYLDKPGRRRLESYVGFLSATLGKHLDVYLVVGPDNRIITAAPRTERIRHH